MKTNLPGDNRFDSGAARYAGYLATPEGRLRADLTLVNLREFLPSARQNESLRVLDLGCGTGAAALHLARLGMHVTLLDSSPAMLELAQRTFAEGGVRDNITIKHANAAQLPGTVQPRSFDIILCHNLLEFLDHPAAVLRAAAFAMHDSSSILSVLVRNQAGEVLKAALQAGNLAMAENNLAADWAEESLYKGKVRLFTPRTLEALLKDASLDIMVRRAVRVVSDYLPPQISRSTDYEQIFAFEQKLARRSEFFGVARYLHCLATCATLGWEANA